MQYRFCVPASMSCSAVDCWGTALWGTGVLVEALLEGGTDSDIREAEAALERLSSQPVLDGSAFATLFC